MRTNLLVAVTMPAFSLASACSCRKRPCSLNQRDMRLGSMPMASMTSALRRLLVASVPAVTAMPLASASGFRDTTSLT
ncbi:hypothetical protein D9M69_695180 [compost metagenome]